MSIISFAIGCEPEIQTNNKLLRKFDFKPVYKKFFFQPTIYILLLKVEFSTKYHRSELLEKRKIELEE